MPNKTSPTIVKTLSPHVRIIRGRSSGKQKGNLYLQVTSIGNNEKIIPCEGYQNALDVEHILIRSIVRALATTVTGRSEIRAIVCSDLMMFDSSC